MKQIKIHAQKRSAERMILGDVWTLLERTIFPVSSTNTYFNQYNDNIPDLDLPGAEKIRRINLRKYLESHPKKPKVLLVGEAPGYRGCRFSGVPFTSEAQLCSGKLPFTGERTNCKNTLWKENTATIFWKVMTRYHPKFIAWNCFPFHPHSYDNRLTNRHPRKREIHRYSKTLNDMISLLEPKVIIAVGKKAEETLHNLNYDPIYVRHPARGGAIKFKQGITKILSQNNIYD